MEREGVEHDPLAIREKNILSFPFLSKAPFVFTREKPTPPWSLRCFTRHNSPTNACHLFTHHDVFVARLPPRNGQVRLGIVSCAQTALRIMVNIGHPRDWQGEEKTLEGQ